MSFYNKENEEKETIKMNTWSVEKIQEFYTYLNEYFGLSVNPEIKLGERNRLPVQWDEGKILFISDFFNDEEIEEDVRINMLLIMYSGFHHAKYNDNHIGVHPMFMVKGICKELGYKFLSDKEIEDNLRKVRRKLYQDNNAFFFKVGYNLRESACMRYEVTKVERTEDEIFVTVKPVGYHLGEPEKVFREEELYNRTCSYESIDDVKVDMRKNLVVISGPSGVGKTTVVKEVLKQHPELNKTVSVTTRRPRKNEVNGKDYYFVSTEEFYEHQLNGKLLEHNIYNQNHYGTLYSEIDKYPIDKPLILVIDTSGRRSVLRHFPLSTTIFIQTPSIVELRKRIENRGENSEDEILERIETATKEMEETIYYDYVVMNEDVKKCAGEISEIIRENVK